MDPIYVVWPSIQPHDDHDVEAVTSRYSCDIELVLGFERTYLPIVMRNY